MKKFLLGALVAVTTMFMASCSLGGGSSNYSQGGDKPVIDRQAGTVNGKAYDNTTECCWKITLTEKIMGVSVSTDTYGWSTEFLVVASMEMEMWEIAQEGIGSASYSYTKDSAKDAETCLEQNKDDDDDDWGF